MSGTGFQSPLEAQEPTLSDRGRKGSPRKLTGRSIPPRSHRIAASSTGRARYVADGGQRRLRGEKAPHRARAPTVVWAPLRLGWGPGFGD